MMPNNIDNIVLPLIFGLIVAVGIIFIAFVIWAIIDLRIDMIQRKKARKIQELVDGKRNAEILAEGTKKITEKQLSVEMVTTGMKEFQNILIQANKLLEINTRFHDEIKKTEENYNDNFKRREIMMTSEQRNRNEEFIDACRDGNLGLAKKIHKDCEVDIHVFDDQAFRWACENGHTETAKWLYSIDDGIGVDIHVREDQAFIWACENGHTETAKWLYSLDDKINIHAWGDYTFRCACGNGQLEIAKWLYSIDDGIGIDIHVREDQAFIWACKNGQLETAKWLYSLDDKINIHAYDDEAFRWACKNGHTETVAWLKSIGEFE